MAAGNRAFIAGAVLASAAIIGCGGEDVTTLTHEDAVAEELTPDAPSGESRVFSVLARPESVDAVCRVIGASAARAAPGECASVVESCREGLGSALGGRRSPELPDADLEPLVGCPLTIGALDGCIAGVLERGVDRYGSALGCDTPAPPAIDTLALFASPECLVVALFCPDLAASLGGMSTPPSRGPR